MRFIRSEFGHNYKKYSFGYALHLLREEGDPLSEIYGQGYLPYSGSPEAKGVFYMARSARVPLKNFSLNSENRRVAKKFDGCFVRGARSVQEFLRDEGAVSFCLAYFEKKHGAGVMPRERLMIILDSGLFDEIITYHTPEGAPVAYVCEVREPSFSHFWYSFYDLSYARQSLGMWLMIDSAREAKRRGAEYFYVGTVYNAKALYKTAFGNLEFWSGSAWVADANTLKELARRDGEREISFEDVWKRGRLLF